MTLLLLCNLFSVLVSEVCQLGDEVFFLFIEPNIVTLLNICDFVSMTFLLSRELLSVPSVKTLKLLSLLVEFSRVRIVFLLLVLEPFLLPVVELLSQIICLLVSLKQFFMVPGFLFVDLVDVDILGVGSLLFLLLDLLHQLVNLRLETLLEFLLHLSVLV